ncbi:hypothetical protein PILCRDRAFT_815263 [Piloderma croceum F 1598]|uniref:Chromatin modification-related protein n=1 Tax=Piloderma croceum (strain F 1598) TaxID=765440 RepID=A0A0C3GAN4_PILCF|nr:hypothetical protein PILCRDRAFT_815263 [Piloderma croceum F 1598]
MSYRRSRKRRRSQAFPAEEDEEAEAEGEDAAIRAVKDTLQNGENSEENGEVTTEELKKEFEIWDAFREEHFEAIEQLPLSLHRQYILLRELDEQAQGYSKDLLPTIQRYIELRKSLAARTESEQPPDVEQPTKSEPPPTPIQNLRPSFNGNGSTTSRPASPTKDQGTPAPALPMKTPLVASLATTRTPTPMTIPPHRMKQPQTTREMLSHIAWLSEEVLRASEEKVNLAQAAYDSVDRHIRLLDQSIKEQEAAISLGVRPGTHLAPILLPELIVPGSRAARAAAAHSPAPPPPDEEGGMTLGMVGDEEDGGEEVQPQRRGRAAKKGKARGRLKKEDTVVVVEPEQQSGSRSRNRVGTARTLKLTGPALEQEAMPPPPLDEERYCYCNQVSFGEMVACDNENCEREWFHLGCVGLERSPADDESWYCRDCQHLAKGNKRTKTRQRKRR